MIKEWFKENVSQPVNKFYHKYILGEKDWSDDTANNVIQESSESLDTHIQSNENDII